MRSKRWETKVGRQRLRQKVKKVRWSLHFVQDEVVGQSGPITSFFVPAGGKMRQDNHIMAFTAIGLVENGMAKQIRAQVAHYEEISCSPSSLATTMPFQWDLKKSNIF